MRERVFVTRIEYLLTVCVCVCVRACVGLCVCAHVVGWFDRKVLPPRSDFAPWVGIGGGNRSTRRNLPTASPLDKCNLLNIPRRDVNPERLTVATSVVTPTPLAAPPVCVLLIGT